MKWSRLWAIPVLTAGIALIATAACGEARKHNPKSAAAEKPDSTLVQKIHNDSILALEADSLTRYESLTEEDYQLVAEELGVEVAAMKAVVSIEAGSRMKGFWAPGVPVVNFDPSIYRKVASKAPDTSGDRNAKVPEGLTGHALREWTQLTDARHKNAQGADMGSFWGMFQIGGFHYKKCGCATVNEFVAKMSNSELDQLELFAIFIKNSGMLEYLRKKDWAKFARAYNGAGYAKKGYHTRMAKAYAKFKK